MTQLENFFLAIIVNEINERDKTKPFFHDGGQNEVRIMTLPVYLFFPLVNFPRAEVTCLHSVRPSLKLAS